MFIVMDYSQSGNGSRALALVDELLELTAQARRHFGGAKGWGIVDLFGGGLLSNLFKHSKLSAARDAMSRIDARLDELRSVLADPGVPSGYAMSLGGFSSFADFVFDGLLADAYMQSKIAQSLHQVEELERELLSLRARLAGS